MANDGSRPTFIAFLGKVEDGRLHDDLTDQMRDLVATMQREATNRGGKPKGKISITIDLTLDGGVFEVKADTKVTPPKTVRSRSIFYRTSDNGLSANNPKQLDMMDSPPRDVIATDRTDIRIAR